MKIVPNIHTCRVLRVQINEEDESKIQHRRRIINQCEDIEPMITILPLDFPIFNMESNSCECMVIGIEWFSIMFVID